MSTSSAFAAADGEQDGRLSTTVFHTANQAGVVTRAAGNKSSSAGTGSKASGTTAVPSGILKNPPPTAAAAAASKEAGKENRRSSSRLQRDKPAAAAPERPKKQQKLQPAIVPAGSTMRQSKAAIAREAFLNQPILVSAAASGPEEYVYRGTAKAAAIKQLNKDLLVEYATWFDKVQLLLNDPLIDVSDALAARPRKFRPFELPSKQDPTYVDMVSSLVCIMEDQNVELEKEILRQKSAFEELSSLQTSLQEYEEDTTTCETLRSESNAVDGRIRTEQASLKAAEKMSKSFDTKAAGLQSSVKAKREQVFTEEESAEKSHATVVACENEVRTLSEQLKAAQKRLGAEKAKKDGMKRTLKSSKQELSKLEEQSDAVDEQVRAKKGEVESIRKTVEKSIQEFNALQKKIDVAEERERVNKEKVNATRERILGKLL